MTLSSMHKKNKKQTTFLCSLLNSRCQKNNASVNVSVKVLDVVRSRYSAL